MRAGLGTYSFLRFQTRAFRYSCGGTTFKCHSSAMVEVKGHYVNLKGLL